MPTALNLIKGDKMGAETDYRDALPVNMTAVIRDVFGAKGYMIQEAGLTAHGTGAGIDRGGIWNERFQDHYRVSGSSLLSVAASGVSSSLGAISGADIVSLPYSFNTQGIVADGKFWLYSPSGGLVQVTDPDLGSPIDCVWVDGYYFFTDGEYIYHTDISSESAIDPLKYATSEFSPDPTLGVAKTGDNKVVVFNRYTTEYFVNVATDDFAFQKVATRAIKIGIVGTHCKIEVGDTWFIMGGRKEEAVGVHQLGVGAANKVSTREIDKIIGLYNEAQLSVAELETYQEDGYAHVIVHLPNHTLKFNYTVAQAFGPQFAWSIIKSDVLGDNPWRGINGVFDARIGQWVFGDKNGPLLGILDNTVGTQYGNIVEWVMYTPYAYIEDQSIDQLEIQTIPGFTTTVDATVFLSLSYDGVTWGNERTIEYGGPYEYSKRFIVYRLGYVRDWVGFKLRGATRSRMAFTAAVIEHG